MYYVTVERFRPYVEDLEYEFDDYNDAKLFSEGTCVLVGVIRVVIRNQAGRTVAVFNDYLTVESC